MTGWRAVHDAMVAARLEGSHASPKSLRHGFGVAAGFWGHPAQHGPEMARTCLADHDGVYADAVGAEEKDIASRMWS